MQLKSALANLDLRSGGRGLWHRGISRAESRINMLGARAGKLGREFTYCELLQAGYAPKAPQEFSRRFLAHARNFSERRAQPSAGTALTVEGDREAMRLIPDLLDQMQDGRVTVQNNRLIFSSQNIKNLFFFRDAGERLINDGQFFQSFGCGMELA